MNPQYWTDRGAVIRQRRYQLAVGANPRAAIEGVVERVVDVDLLVDGVLRVFHVLHCSGIVEPRRIPLASHGREIDEGVGSVAADDPHRNTPAHIPFDGSPVVSAVEINADFFRFTKVESPLEVGRTVTGLDANIHDSLAGAHYSRLLVATESQTDLSRLASTRRSYSPALENRCAGSGYCLPKVTRFGRTSRAMLI